MCFPLGPRSTGKPKGRPKMAKKARVKIDTTVDADTFDAIGKLQRPGESRGQVIDRAIDIFKAYLERRLPLQKTESISLD